MHHLSVAEILPYGVEKSLGCGRRRYSTVKNFIEPMVRPIKVICIRRILAD
jgi:hypothetical protein